MYTMYLKDKASSNRLIGCCSPPSLAGTKVSPVAVLDCPFCEIARVLLNADTGGVLAKRKAVLL